MLMSQISLNENDDKLVARNKSRLKFNLHGELLMHSICSLEESYQMKLKVEEKSKWGLCKKVENSRTTKEKMIF